MLIFIGLLEILDVLQVFGSVLVVEVLLRDSTLTNFACAVLVICDAACVVYASVTRIYQKVRTITWSRAQRRRQKLDANDAFVQPPTTHADLDRALPNNNELQFSEAHVNIDNIKMRVFEKKYI